jgi:hypothetical protein
VTLRREADGYGLGGWSHYLESPADIDTLPRAVRKLLEPPRLQPSVLELFAGFPASLRERAGAATFPPLARWLRSLAKTRCELEVHRPDGLPPSVMLRFHHPASDARASWAPALVPVSPRKIPRACPPLLREIYTLAGGINLQYACSGSLVAPGDGETAHRLVLRTWSSTSPELRDCAFYGSLADYAHVELRTARPLWEADGDFLFWTPQGSTFWLGHEHYGGVPGADWGRLEEALARIFRALLAHEYFHA